MSIANSNDEVNQSFDNLTLSQLCNFLESCKEYVYKTDVTHSFCLCQIYENSSLLARGLNKQTKKQKIKEKLPNNQHDLVERFSCNSDEAECMLEKRISCKSSDLIDQIVLVESSEAKGSEDSSDSVNSEILRTLNSIMMLLRLRFTGGKKSTKYYQSYE